MKKIIILLIVAGNFLFFNAQAQEYFQGSVKVDLTSSGPYLVFQIKLTSPAAKTCGFSGIEFFVTYSDTYTMTFGSVVNNTTNFPTLAVLYGGQNPWGSISGKTIEWWYFTGTATTSQTYNVGQEYEVFRVPISTSSLDFGDLNLEFDGGTFYTYFVLTDNIGSGLTTYDKNLDIPVFYGPGTYSGANGSGVFAGGACMYSIFDKPLVPMVLWDDAAWAGGSGTGNQPGAGDAAKKCYIKDASGNLTVSNGSVLNLIIEAGADLSIAPGGSLSAAGATTITDANALKILANASGVGSFIDNGTINYGTNGSASVQTYVSNLAPTGYYAHLVGPTINDPAFETTNGYTGVYLGSFDLATLGTYAYQYLEASNTWGNIFETSTPIRTAKGILLSTANNTSYTMTMTGELITGNVSSANLQYGANGLDLLSNIYPSSLDFDLFYAANSAKILNVYRVYDPASGYRFHNTTGGGDLTKDIQVGQGFFVETQSTSAVNFTNSMRLHSSSAFLKFEYANQLRLDVAGGTKGFTSTAFIYFNEGGSNAFDPLYDVTKWWNMASGATEIWSVGEGQEQLSMNTLPLLGTSDVSVPVSFTCGEEGNYSLEASQIGSFGEGTQIYLEDLETGAEWHDLVVNPVYFFAANPDGLQNRFVLHFFGPTGLGEGSLGKNIIIYSGDHSAFIVNKSNEVIEEYYVYDVMGRELQHGTLPASTVNKVFIGQTTGYYVVKVVTNNKTYSEKVFIN